MSIQNCVAPVIPAESGLREGFTLTLAWLADVLIKAPDTIHPYLGFEFRGALGALLSRHSHEKVSSLDDHTLLGSIRHLATDEGAAELVQSLLSMRSQSREEISALQLAA